MSALQILDFTCPACGETQRRVILDRMQSETTCANKKCRHPLRWRDGTLRPGLAKCGEVGA